MRVVANDVLLLELDEHRAGPQRYLVAVPPAAYNQAGHLLIEIEPANAMSPAQAGLSDDGRPLSIGLISLTLDTGPPPRPGWLGRDRGRGETRDQAFGGALATVRRRLRRGY
jgi:hypothetical protein